MVAIRLHSFMKQATIRSVSILCRLANIPVKIPVLRYVKPMLMSDFGQFVDTAIAGPVVACNLYFARPSVLPNETDSPLIIDSNTVLPSSIAL